MFVYAQTLARPSKQKSAFSFFGIFPFALSCVRTHNVALVSSPRSRHIIFFSSFVPEKKSSKKYVEHKRVLSFDLRGLESRARFTKVTKRLVFPPAQLMNIRFSFRLFSLIEKHMYGCCRLWITCFGSHVFHLHVYSVSRWASSEETKFPHYPNIVSERDAAASRYLMSSMLIKMPFISLRNCLFFFLLLKHMKSFFLLQLRRLLLINTILIGGDDECLYRNCV